MKNAKPRLSRPPNKNYNTRRNAYLLMTNKLHHRLNHLTQPQPLQHLFTQQLLKPLPQAIPHHHNLATQPHNLPQSPLTQPQSHLINQVINHQGKDVSLQADSVVKLSEKNHSIQILTNECHTPLSNKKYKKS